jgi:hypothetical protein
VHNSLSDKKRLLQLAIFSVIESMRTNPEKYSSLVYHNNNENTSRDNGNSLRMNSSTHLLAPLPYDSYIIEHYKSTLFQGSEKLYNNLVNYLVCEVVNEDVTEQPVPTPSPLPELPFQDDDKQEHN